MARIYIPQLSLHVYHRGNNRMTIFEQDHDREVYLKLIEAASARHDVSIHGWVLMSTHIHAVVTPSNRTALPSMMKELNERYVRYFNRKCHRSGTLWEGRYRAKHLFDEQQWLTCLRYVEQNPVRAHMVRAPDAYPWSSYAAHGLGAAPEWHVRHAVYLKLGANDAERQAAYRALCAEPLPDAELACIRNHWLTPEPEMESLAV